MVNKGDTVKLKKCMPFVNFMGKNLFEVIEIDGENASIKNEFHTIFCHINHLELVEDKKMENEEKNKVVVFTGEEIKLDNKLGAIAEIYYGYNEQKKKCICVDIKANNTITAFFNNLDEVNLFLKSLGFKEILEEKFNLVKVLRENLTKVEFIPWKDNFYIYYDHNTKSFEFANEAINEEVGKVYLTFNSFIDKIKMHKITSQLTDNKVKPKQLKEAYKELGWL